MHAAQAIRPNAPVLAEVSGEILAAQGRYADAVNRLTDAERQGDDESSLYMWLGTSYAQVGLPDKAISAFEKAIDLQPYDWLNYNRFGYFYFNQGRYADAAREYEAALKLTPDNATLLLNLGGVLYELRRYDQAQIVLQRSLAIHATLDGWLNLGLVYKKRGQWAEAADAYEKALEVDPDRYVAWEDLAKVYARFPGGHERSEDAFRKALQLCRKDWAAHPDSGPVAASLASYLAFTGSRQEALEMTERALALAPGDADTMITAADVYETLGFRSSALEWANKAIKSGYPKSDVVDDQALADLVKDSRFAAGTVK